MPYQKTSIVMHMFFRPLALLVFSLSLLQSPISLGQDAKKSSENETTKDWQNLDFATDKVYGTSANRVFSELIQDRKPEKKIVVAVIDSGVDIEHEDLSGSIWTNTDEVPGNGLDDDGNGYADDIHGWNFLVDENGDDITYANLEATRVLRLSKQLKESNGEYPAWLTGEVIDKALEIYNTNVEEYKSMKQLSDIYVILDSLLIAETGKQDYTYEDIAAIYARTEQLKKIKEAYALLDRVGITKADLVEMADQSSKFEQYYLNMDFHSRRPLDPEVVHYGNNHYEGESADHGTHVAGIIAANRNNGVGARGIAHECAEIMVVRAVPDGDEDDIDVANAIRYAVDNGANIINMSFGKGLSPYKSSVDNAIRYATEHNVLIIHAAGNDSEDNDEVQNFPNPFYENGGRASSYITVGASSAETNKNLSASFSNYGSESVDLFAPGHEIYSTMPGNEYKQQSGTSMAAPVVAGVAALVWAYHPGLTADELKEVLLNSSTRLPKKKVLLPGGGKKKVRFSELSQTAGIVNAYEAMKLAGTVETIN